MSSRLRHRLATAGLASVCALASGCFLFAPNTQSTTTAQAQADPYNPADAYVQQWDAYAEQYADAAEGDPVRVEALWALQAIYVQLVVGQPNLKTEVPLAEWEALLTEKTALDTAYWQAQVEGWSGDMPEAASERPTDSLGVLHGITLMYLTARGDGADVAQPHLVAMLTVDRQHDDSDLVYDDERYALETYEALRGRPAIHEGCRAAVDALPKKAKHQRNMVIMTCEANQLYTWREDLPMWASQKEIKAFEKKYGADLDAAAERQRQAEIAAAEEARARAEAEAYAASQAAATPSYDSGSSGGGGGSSSSAPAAPSVVSVTLRNSCSSTVKVFYGDKPKFGSGTQSSLSGNSRTSKQMRPGDMVWLTDDSGNGIASATVSAGTREIEVSSSCSGISAR